MKNLINVTILVVSLVFPAFATSTPLELSTAATAKKFESLYASCMKKVERNGRSMNLRFNTGARFEVELDNAYAGG